MNTIEKAVKDLRETFQATDIIALAQRIADLEATVLDLQLRLENAENELQNQKAQYRTDQWNKVYAELGTYEFLKGCQ